MKIMNVKKASITIFFSVLFLTALAIPKPGSAGTASSDAATSRGVIDRTLAKTVTAAMFEHKEKKIFLVDVRPPEEFDRFHIPGALNIPLHAVKTKAFLKTKPLLLVNAGYEVGPLADACMLLRSDGFKASIMAGGLCAWKAGGGALTGDPFAQREIDLITPQQFQREQPFGHQKVIQLSDAKAARKTPEVPGVETMPSNSARTLTKIKTWLGAKDASPFRRVVLMTATGRDNHRIRRWLSDAGFHRQVFLLRGGAAAYRQHLKFARLARKSKKERTMRTGGCPTCAQEQE